MPPKVHQSPVKSAPPPKPKAPAPVPPQAVLQSMPQKPSSPIKPPGDTQIPPRAVPPRQPFNTPQQRVPEVVKDPSPRTVQQEPSPRKVQPPPVQQHQPSPIAQQPQPPAVQQQPPPQVPQQPPRALSRSGFEKAKPSEKARAVNPSINSHKISPQRANSPERKRAPPPVTEQSRLNTRNLGANKAVLDSTKGDDSTVKGQIISAEKTFLVMCSSGLDTYANNNQQLTERDKEYLFANLDGIINAHTDVLGKITDSSSASDILLSLVPHLHLYLSYIANMSTAFTTLSDLRERGVFFEVNQKDTLHAQTIEALLERPKQYLESYPATISVINISFNFTKTININIYFLKGFNGKSGSIM